MKTAMNELTSLCRAALEGSGWAQGDYEDAADAAVWLQAVGFGGLEALDGMLGAQAHEQYTVKGAACGEHPARQAPVSPDACWRSSLHGRGRRKKESAWCAFRVHLRRVSRCMVLRR